MPNTYTPSPVQLGNVTEPIGGEFRNVASVTLMTRRIADGIQFLDAARVTAQALRGQLAALNYGAAVAPGGLVSAAAYDAPRHKWYVVGGTENVRSSFDQGNTWDGASLVAAVGSDENCCAIDIDTSGNVVVATETNYVFTLNAGTFTWARVDTGIGVFSGVYNAVTYDPIANLWCWANDSLMGTSPDRATWTSRTLPTNWPVEDGYTVNLVCKKSTGRTVGISRKTNLRPAYSTDGGVTWTTATALTTGVTSPTESCMIYNPTTDEFIYAVGETSGTPSGEIWVSTDDGVTWTLRCTLANHCLMAIAAVGHLLISTIRTNSEAVYSIDGGATWYPTGFSVTATTRGAFGSGDGCALLCSSGVVYPPFRTGAPGIALT